MINRFVGIILIALTAASTAVADTQTFIERESLLVSAFTRALETYANGLVVESADDQVNLWIKGLRERGVSPNYLATRLAKKENGLESVSDRYAIYRTLKIEQILTSGVEATPPPVALHAFRLDVIEDYDDVLNDDLYCYFITTHDDMVWGKVTSIYRGLDEGDSVFLTPEDRGLFGPRGEKLVPKNHTIIDYGIIESDGEDIQELHKISSAIVDLASVALTVYHPQAGAAANQAREETKNLLKLLVDLDDDDRLVTDSIRFSPELMMTMLSGSTVHEFAKSHQRSTIFTRFAYRINFRLIR